MTWTTRCLDPSHTDQRVVTRVDHAVLAKMAPAVGGQNDLAVLDLDVRGEIVTPVATALRRAQVQVLIASAYGAAELAGFGLDGCACNIGKPVEPQRLLAALKDIARSATEG